MTEIIQGGPARTYALPNTAASVFTFAFKDRKSLASVRLNAGVQTLGYWCFGGSGIRRLTLSAGVREMSACAFCECARLESADFSAARSLDALPKSAFNGCGRLGRVALGETAEQAVCRELREELAVEARIVRPLWLHQSFFTEEVDHLRYHELCLYFLTEAPALSARAQAFDGAEAGHRHRFEWLPFERLKDEYFYPLFLKEEIFRLPASLTTYE